MSDCEARSGDQVTAHACDDPLACALEHLGPPARTEASDLRELLDEARRVVDGARPSKLRDALMELLS